MSSSFICGFDDPSNWLSMRKVVSGHSIWGWFFQGLFSLKNLLFQVLINVHVRFDLKALSWSSFFIWVFDRSWLSLRKVVSGHSIRVLVFFIGVSGSNYHTMLIQVFRHSVNQATYKTFLATQITWVKEKKLS